MNLRQSHTRHRSTAAAVAPMATMPASTHDQCARRQRPLVRALQLALLAGTLGVTVARAAPAVIPLAGLDGRNGFRLDGAAAGDYSGRAVSAAGDINGDGIDDLIVGADRADPNGVNRAGSSYVVFGRSSGFAATIDLSTLDGSVGFRIDGVAVNDRSGGAVSAAGDINGDGIDDLIIGASGADPNGLNAAGSSYVLFGRSGGFAAAIDLSTLDGSTGFRLDGVAAADYSGIAVSAAGDINGDSIDDLIIGAFRARPNGVTFAGSSYVLFGRSDGFAATIDLATLDGSTGFRLDGAAGDFSGFAVSEAGDVNGDGIDDLVVGAFGASPNGSSQAGSSYVVFGRSGSFASSIDLSTLDGSNGFRLDGVAADDYSGRAVSAAGDVNGDGVDDLIVGAYRARPNGVNDVGSSYVVFGRSGGFPAAINLSTLDGSNGFRLDGAAEGDRSGRAVSAAGDINGDGVDDVIVGADRANPNGVNDAGSSYVVFGRSGNFAATIDLSTLVGSSGFRLDGTSEGEVSGRALSAAGDINGDGIDDVIIGAEDASPNGVTYAGSSYVVFGARERISRDGSEDQNIDVRFPRLAVRNSFAGSAVRWQNGATCNCDQPPFDFNLWRNGSNLAFFWPAATLDGGVAVGNVYSVLQPGAVIGPASTFTNDTTVPATANWRAGVEGYLGFRYVNADSGLVTYGYARIRTTAPTGFPVEVIDFGVNLTGLAVTIPTP